MFGSAVATATMIVFMASLRPTTSVVGPAPASALLLSHTRGRVLGTVAQCWYPRVVSGLLLHLSGAGTSAVTEWWSVRENRDVCRDHGGLRRDGEGGEGSMNRFQKSPASTLVKLPAVPRTAGAATRD